MPGSIIDIAGGFVFVFVLVLNHSFHIPLAWIIAVFSIILLHYCGACAQWFIGPMRVVQFYLNSDIAYIELDIDNDHLYDIYDVTINNIFVCISNRTIDVNLTDSEMRSGIGGCLLNKYNNKLPYVFNDLLHQDGVFTSGLVDIETSNRFYFLIPKDINVKTDKLFIQIQATISIDMSSIRRRNLLQIQTSDQIRHFITQIDLNAVGRGDKATVDSNVPGGSIAAIIIGIILIIFVITFWISFIRIYWQAAFFDRVAKGIKNIVNDIEYKVKQKIKQRKDTPEKLRPMSLAPMVEGLNTNNNYVIAKTIARYFDNIFIDTDTVVILLHEKDK